MSPSRKLSLIGVIGGALALVIGVLAFTVPLLLTAYSMWPPQRMMNFDKHHGLLVGSMMSWMITAPFGFLLVILGAPTLLFSVIIYFDTRRKEASPRKE